MVNRAPLIASLILIAVMAAMSALAWPLVPATHIAVHFDLHGNPNGFADRGFALGAMPVTAILITVLFLAMPFLPGRNGNRTLPQAQGYVAGWLGTLVVLGVAHALIILKARGVLVDVVGSITFLVALLLVVLGNFLGKLQPNDYAGVRTPWTRKSDYAWEKTNRLGGWIMVGVGLLTLCAMALMNIPPATIVMVAGLTGGVAVLVPLSWYFWKQDPDRG
jgi:uncharacterized membrane protein